MNTCLYLTIFEGSRKKKSSSTSGRATKALPTPPLELSGHRNFFFLNFFLVLK